MVIFEGPDPPTPKLADVLRHQHRHGPAGADQPVKPGKSTNKFTVRSLPRK